MRREGAAPNGRIINETVGRAGLRPAKRTPASVDSAEIGACQPDDAGPAFRRAGADFPVVCANAMHKAAGKSRRAGPPLLRIADADAPPARPYRRLTPRASTPETAFLRFFPKYTGGKYP